MGYFWGMLAGIIGALAFPNLFADALPNVAADILPLYLFPGLLLFSGAACVIGSLLSAPEDDQILKNFYRTVRPWGFWGPIHAKVIADDPGFERNKDFGRDMLNVSIGVVAQTCLVAAPIFLVVQQFDSLIATLAVFGVCALILKKTWYDRLEASSSDAERQQALVTDAVTHE